MKKIFNPLKWISCKKNISINSLFCVVADTNGAHEAECVYSVWDTKDKAEREIEYLEITNVQAGCYDGKFYVKEIEINKSYTDWIQ